MSNDKAEGFLEKRIAELERLLFESEQTGNFYPKSPEWIKCSERLPEMEGRYLVYPIGKYYGEVVSFTKWHFDTIPSNSFFFEHIEMFHVVTPTHWMPLPAAPKGEV